MKFKELLESELKSMNIDLVDFEINALSNKTVVKLYVDKLNDLSPKCSLKIKDCEEISRNIERFIDVEELFPKGYILEVSTPGLDRVLRNINDYIRFKDQEVKVTLKDNKENGFFEGKIRNAKENLITFDINGEEKTFDISNIKKTRLKF